jgi:hypothetical protein
MLAAEEDGDEQALDKACQEVLILETMIAGTAARTLVGVREQVRLVSELEGERLSAHDNALMALRQALGTLDRLLGLR